ncbi:MAG: OmpA family protein [Rhodobacteraceae bacterium]|nr:OmpA family protein [Paracoccaceae bacterium]
MAEAENRFCWHCLFLALVPLLLLLGLGWWATSQYQINRTAETNETESMIEAVADLEEQNADLQADLARAERDLEDARSLARTADQWTFQDLLDRALALPQEERKRLLRRLGVEEQGFNLNDLRERLAALSREEQAEIWASLPAVKGFRDWYGGIEGEQQRAWVASLPGSLRLTSPEEAARRTVTAPGYGEFDGDGVARRLRMMDASLTRIREEKSQLEARLQGAGGSDEAGADLAKLRAELAAARKQAQDAERAQRQAEAGKRVAEARGEEVADQLQAGTAKALAESAKLRAELRRLRSEAATPAPAPVAAPIPEAPAAFPGASSEMERVAQERDAARSALALLRSEAEDMRAELAAAKAQASEVETARAGLSERLRGVLEQGGADAEDAEGDGAETAPARSQTERPQALRLSANVAFDSGAATLNRAGRQALDKVADEIVAELRSRPSDRWRLLVEGHTDRVPIKTREFPSNWELSAARAAAVARYLGERGVPQDRIVAVGRAEFEPLDEARTREAYALNRRIEFEIAPQ